MKVIRTILTLRGAIPRGRERIWDCRARESAHSLRSCKDGPRVTGESSVQPPGTPPTNTGQIVILNGVPRSGKSTIAREIQTTFPGLWINLGVDHYSRCLPEAYLPGVGLRPRDPRFDQPEPGRVPLSKLEEWVPVLFAALYESIAAHSRLGLNVVVDVAHHDMYSKRRGILKECARRLSGLPVLFVGVLCPADTVWERREETWGQVRGEVSDGVRAAVELWNREIHLHGGYDLEVDTSKLKPDQCADVIRKRLTGGPPGSRFEELARTNGRKS
jgi:chloramphenicol 3-O phosphotransferase